MDARRSSWDTGGGDRQQLGLFVDTSFSERASPLETLERSYKPSETSAPTDDGLGGHHSGLTTDERKYIETAYRFGSQLTGVAGVDTRIST